MSAISIPALAGHETVAAAKPVAQATQISNGADTSARSPASTTATLSNVRYPNPHIVIDPSTGRVVYEIRNAETGQLTNQTPSNQQLRAYRLQQGLLSPEQAASPPVKSLAASGKLSEIG